MDEYFFVSYVSKAVYISKYFESDGNRSVGSALVDRYRLARCPFSTPRPTAVAPC